MDVLYDEFKDSKYRAHPLLRKMVRGGYLGRKTKKKDSMIIVNNRNSLVS